MFHALSRGVVVDRLQPRDPVVLLLLKILPVEAKHHRDGHLRAVHPVEFPGKLQRKDPDRRPGPLVRIDELHAVGHQAVRSHPVRTRGLRISGDVERLSRDAVAQVTAEIEVVNRPRRQGSCDRRRTGRGLVGCRKQAIQTRNGNHRIANFFIKRVLMVWTQRYSHAPETGNQCVNCCVNSTKTPPRAIFRRSGRWISRSSGPSGSAWGYTRSGG